MFDKAETRSDELEKNYELLDTWKKRSDDLLYSMIPKTVADRLRSGQSPLSTCEVHIFDKQNQKFPKKFVFPVI